MHDEIKQEESQMAYIIVRTQRKHDLRMHIFRFQASSEIVVQSTETGGQGVRPR